MSADPEPKTDPSTKARIAEEVQSSPTQPQLSDSVPPATEGSLAIRSSLQGAEQPVIYAERKQRLHQEPAANPSMKLEPTLNKVSQAPRTKDAPKISENITIAINDTDDDGQEQDEISEQEVLKAFAPVSLAISRCLPPRWKKKHVALNITIRSDGEFVAVRVMDPTLYDTPTEACIRAKAEPLKVRPTYRKVQHIKVKIPIDPSKEKTR